MTTLLTALLTGLLTQLFTFFAGGSPTLPDAVFADGGKTTCVVADGPWIAEAQWQGHKVRARQGMLQVGDRKYTACDGLPGAFPTALSVVDGRLFVGFRAAGVQLFDGEGFEGIAGLPTDGVRALAGDATTLWIGLGVEGLYRYEAGARRAMRFKHWILGRKGITALGFSKHGRLEIGAGPYGWWRIEAGRTRRVERGRFIGCFKDGVPGDMHSGCSGAAPVPGADDASATNSSGLPSGHVTALAHHQGVLYVGTFDGGLARRGPDGFEAVHGAPRFINALLSDGLDLWIATPRGLFQMGSRGVVRSRLPLPSQHINALTLGTDGTLWVATSRGLAGFGPGGSIVHTVASGLPGRIVYAVAATADGAIWAGTDHGAARIAVDGTTVFTQANGGLTHDWVNALVADGNAVFAGTYDAGVVHLTADGQGVPVPGLESAWVNPGGLRFVGGRLTVSTLGDGYLSVRKGQAVRRSGLPSEDVTAALLHEGSLYVGTRGGLARIDL